MSWKLNIIIGWNKTTNSKNSTFDITILKQCLIMTIDDYLDLTINAVISPCFAHFFVEPISKCLKTFTNGCCHELLFILAFCLTFTLLQLVKNDAYRIAFILSLVLISHESWTIRERLLNTWFTTDCSNRVTSTRLCICFVSTSKKHIYLFAIDISLTGYNFIFLQFIQPRKILCRKWRRKMVFTGNQFDQTVPHIYRLFLRVSALERKIRSIERWSW